MDTDPGVDSVKTNEEGRKTRARSKAEKKLGAKQQVSRSKTSTKSPPGPSQPAETVEPRSESVKAPQLTPSPLPPVKPIITLLCIPAYNEEKEIGPLIIKSREYFDQILVCDDGSDDLMGQVAGGLGANVIRNEVSLGRLASLRTLLEHSLELDSAITLVMDIDPNLKPSEITMILSPIRLSEADVVFGVKQGAGGGGEDDLRSLFMAFSKKSVEAFLTAPQDVLGSHSRIVGVSSDNGLKLREVPLERQAEPQPMVKIPQPSSDVANTKDQRAVSNPFKVMWTRPDLFFGIPGLVLMAIGFYYGYYLFTTFLNLKYLSLPAAFAMILGIVSGLLLFMTSIIIAAFSDLIKQS